MRHHLRNSYFIVIVLAGLGTILSACGAFGGAPTPTLTATPTDIPTPTLTPTPIPRSATLKTITGTVEVRHGADGTFAPAEEGQVLTVEDELRTGKDGRAVILLDDGAALAVASDSQVSLKKLEGVHETPITQFFLTLGKLFGISGGELPAGASFEIDTPRGTAAIRGSMLGVAFSERLGARVSCLVGHCTAGIQDKVLELTGGKAATITEAGPGETTDMTPADRREWSVALNQLKTAGADINAGVDPTCSCEGTDLKCADGSVLPAFPTCIEGQSCECDGPNLVCPDKTYDNDPVCTNGAASCTCEGPNLFCDNGASFFNSAACTGGSLCLCEGADLKCNDGTTYPNDIACANTSASCTCTEGFQICSDGTVNFNTSACGNSSLPCTCQGTTFVCTQDGQTISFPDYPLCGGGQSGGNCFCVGTDLYCADGSITPGACTGAPSIPSVPELPVP